MRLLSFPSNHIQKIGLRVISIVLLGLAMPQSLVIPVSGASDSSYNPQSFWYYPWGRSVTHKGIDIFAAKGTKVIAATYSLVLYQGNIPVGGNVIIALGPKWRLHYYAHLAQINTQTLAWLSTGQVIGKVGNTGNAQGKAPHLHYALVSLIPYPWRIDGARQGWKKMFYLNPMDYWRR